MMTKNSPATSIAAEFSKRTPPRHQEKSPLASPIILGLVVLVIMMIAAKVAIGAIIIAIKTAKIIAEFAHDTAKTEEPDYSLIFST